LSALATRTRRDIQGLRAVAVLLVALDHAGVSFLHGGYVGVDVFFVLSGYLITGVLTSSTASPRRGAFFTAFYARRARRILPAATLTILATDIAAATLLNLVRAHQVFVDSLWTAFFAANFHFAAIGTNYFASQQPASPLQHFWSLAVEEQFYVVWPLLVALTLLGVGTWRRSRRRPPTARRFRSLSTVAFVVTVASLAYASVYVHHNATAAYFSTPARAWELGLGALLSLQVERFARLPISVRAGLGWAGIAAIAVASVIYSPSTEFPGPAALLPTLGAAAVIAAGISEYSGILAPARLLSTLPMRFIGDRSYTFYLWHWPVLIIAMLRAGHELKTSTNLLLLIGAFALSCVTYALFENPIRHSRRIPIRGSLAFWPVGILVVFCYAGWHWSDLQNALNAQTGSRVSAVAPLPLAPAVSFSQAADDGTTYNTASPAAVIAAVKAVQRNAHIPSGLTPSTLSLANDLYSLAPNCYAQANQSTSPICSFGATSSAKTLVVFGDSHAQMWLPPIISFGSHAGYDVKPIIKHGCNPFRWAGAGGTATCEGWFSWAVGRVKALHPAVLLIVGHYNVSPIEANIAVTGPQSIANTTGLMTAVKSHLGKIVVIGDPPGQTAEPTDCLLSAHATMGMCSRQESEAQLALTQDMAVATHEFGSFIDATPWLCYQRKCPMVVGHTNVYVDHDHITDTYAQELDPTFSAAMTSVLEAKPPSHSKPKPKNKKKKKKKTG
jgi:peptidoglycan/LPS O-acetylase OafA/YrhL